MKQLLQKSKSKNLNIHSITWYT